MEAGLRPTKQHLALVANPAETGANGIISARDRLRRNGDGPVDPVGGGTAILPERDIFHRVKLVPTTGRGGAPSLIVRSVTLGGSPNRETR